jgi:hypothetical protein
LNRELNARLPKGSDSGHLYIEGYRLAAEFLIERVANTAFDQDFLVYPICFLYRHYVELSLKDIIGTGQELVDEDSAPPGGHELQKLWVKARLHIEREFSGETSQLTRADELIAELADTDATSQTFRYRVDNRGRPHLAGQEVLNLGQFAEAMRELSRFLEGCGCGLGEHLSIKRDLESELVEESWPE